MAINIISIPLIIIPLSLYFDYILISGTPISISEIIIDLAYMFLYNKKTPSLSFRITKADFSSVVPLCITAFITNYSLSSLSFSNSFFCNVKITSLLTLALMLNMLSISEGCSRVISQNPFCRFAPPNDSLKSRSLLWRIPFTAFLFINYISFTLFRVKTQETNLT